MLATLILGLLVAGPAARDPDPPLRLWFDRDEEQYNRGERVGVYLQTRDDQYLVVLHLDPENRIRVLFPIDPQDDNYVRGGKRYKLLSRGGREGFVAEVVGRGVVLAASSTDPFRFDDFTGDTWWDYRALNAAMPDGDPEDRLVALVDRMSTSRFDYDVIRYTAFALDDDLAPSTDLGVGPDAIVECLGCGPNTTVVVGPAGPTWCTSPLYDPLCYDPLMWSPGWVPPAFWNVGWGWFGTPVWGAPVWGVPAWGGGWQPVDQYQFKQASRRWNGTGPRYRPRGASTVATNTVVAPLPSTGRTERADPRRGSWPGDVPVPVGVPASGGGAGEREAPRAEPRERPRAEPSGRGRASAQDPGSRRTWSSGGEKRPSSDSGSGSKGSTSGGGRRRG